VVIGTPEAQARGEEWKGRCVWEQAPFLTYPRCGGGRVRARAQPIL
jgi:hypothetical protein